MNNSNSNHQNVFGLCWIILATTNSRLNNIKANVLYFHIFQIYVYGFAVILEKVRVTLLGHPAYSLYALPSVVVYY